MEILTNLLKKEELGRLLRVSKRTIDRLCAEGCPVRNVGCGKKKVFRFDLEEVEEWLESRSF